MQCLHLRELTRTPSIDLFEVDRAKGPWDVAEEVSGGSRGQRALSGTMMRKEVTGHTLAVRTKFAVAA